MLALNLALVVSLTWTGILADSSGLIANAADNASDAAVYALSLFAIGRALHWKRGAAAVSGVLLVLFAGSVLLDAVRRLLYGSEPIGSLMLLMAGLAAVLNLTCLLLLRRLGRGDVNLRAVQTLASTISCPTAGSLSRVHWWRGPASAGPISWSDSVSRSLLQKVAWESLPTHAPSVPQRSSRMPSPSALPCADL